MLLYKCPDQLVALSELANGLAAELHIHCCIARIIDNFKRLLFIRCRSPNEKQKCDGRKYHRYNE